MEQVKRFVGEHAIAALVIAFALGALFASVIGHIRPPA
jgi:hypothetical protein